MATKNPVFGNLLRGMLSAIAGFEGKTIAVIEEELGEQINMAATALQYFKIGNVPGEPRNIAILAEAGVKRAYLNRRWLERFLHAAQYYDAATLLERLCPEAPGVPPRPPRAHDNLPAPTYSHFVMRAAYGQVLEGLQQRCAAVVLVSMGGLGKTSLAREVAAQCLRSSHLSSLDDPSTIPIFDAVVWVSDVDQPGSTRLNGVLDTIARTLDYPALTRLALPEKVYEVEQLLRQRRVLLVVDNAETITDEALLSWMLRLPEPSKALITTRIYRRAFHQGTWLVELDGMGEQEVRAFVQQQAKQRNIQRLGSDAVYQRLGAATGGSPKAIAMVLGYVKQTGQHVDAVLNSLATTQHDLFTDLFARSWSLLTNEARQLLLALTLFPASASQTALVPIADLSHITWIPAITSLIDLDLVEVEYHSDTLPDDASTSRFRLHPLTRAFLGTKTTEYTTFLAAARARWLAWCIDYAGQFGYTVEDMSRLRLLDAEEATLMAALDWAVETGQDWAVIQIVKGTEFYYYIRALWGQKLALHQHYITAARRLDDPDEQLTALAWHIQLLSRQGSLAEAERYMPELDGLAHHTLTSERSFHYHHTQGLYHLARGDWGAARWAWETILDGATDLPAHMQVGAQHWLATTLAQQGDRQAARALYQTALDLAHAHNYDRFVGRNQLSLALLDIEDDALDQAAKRLDASRDHTGRDDAEQHARLQWAAGRLHVRQGDVEAAQVAYQQAIVLLERMGLLLEHQAAETELRGLQAIYHVPTTAQ